jgi:hypothetical protein
MGGPVVEKLGGLTCFVACFRSVCRLWNFFHNRGITTMLGFIASLLPQNQRRNYCAFVLLSEVKPSF